MQSVQDPGELKAGAQGLQQHMLQQQEIKADMCQQHVATGMEYADGAPLKEDEAQVSQQQSEQPTPAWQNYSSVFTAAKAGMGGVDQQKVKQVVYEMSKV
jgi:hypothetical protein